MSDGKTQTTGWQPIETAPTDGERFIATARIMRTGTKEFLYNGRIVRIVINPHGEWIDRLPTTDQVRRSITEETVITMPQGVYRVGKTKSQAALMIEREDPKTGEWRIVWSVAMRKDIGKRMLNVIALAGAH